MENRKARVSLCMIVRDEERNLAECLTPVAHLFDEIVIVDTGSSDATKEIALRFTPHVYDFQWCDDFSAARNEALKHATGDWIFWLDADDRVSPANVERLAALFDMHLDEQPRVYYMDTTIQQVERSQDVFITSHPRLFRRHPELKWRGRVHEQLRPEPAALGHEVVFTDIQIEHIGYQDRTLTERKARRKLRLLRMDYAIDPSDESTLFHLAMAQASAGAREQARETLLKLVTIGNAARSYLRRVYAALADLAIQDGRPEEAVALAERGLALFPADLHLLFAKANGYYVLEDNGRAALALEAVMSLPPSRHLLIAAAADVQTKLAPRMLASVRRIQERFAEAEQLLVGVIQRFPHDLSAWYNLGLLYLDQRNGLQLAQVVRRLASLRGGRLDAGMLSALWQVRHGDLLAAGPLIDELIVEAPKLPCPRMLRAEWLSRMGASWDEQLKALRDVVRVQPSNTEARRWMALVEHQRAKAMPTLIATVGGPPAVAGTLTVMSGQPVG